MSQYFDHQPQGVTYRDWCRFRILRECAKNFPNVACPELTPDSAEPYLRDLQTEGLLTERGDLTPLGKTTLAEETTRIGALPR